MLSIGAIEQCKHKKGEFLSPYFLVTKPNGDFRFVLNLKSLNKFVDTVHFKLENFKNVKDLLSPNVFMCTIDLKDAYYMVPINKKSRKFLRFQFKDCLFEFTCLPFGLSTAPYVFCKIFKPVMHFLRSQGFLSINYLDDFLLISKTKIDNFKNLSVTCNLLLSLGFIINFEKSNIVPSQSCKFLGFNIDSQRFEIKLPTEKMKKSLLHIAYIKESKRFKIREFAKLIGYLISICPAYTYGWLYTKELEHLKFKSLRKEGGNYNAYMSLNKYCTRDLDWWIQNLCKSGCSIQKENFLLEIFSDASSSGWGASCGTEQTHGFWDPHFKKQHINYLELMAAFLSLKSFAKHLSDCSILLRSDNKTVIALINRMGSCKYSHLHRLTKEVWQWCQDRQIWLFASYVTAKNNKSADRESRIKNIETEYSLSTTAFTKIVERFGQPDIDLFASYSNNKCSKYISWKQDPGSYAVDAFSTLWSSFFYAFPPFTIIGKVLSKIIKEGAEGIMVVPEWKSQPWYPLFLKLLLEDPLYFKPHNKLILSPSRMNHPIWDRITLVVGRLSGKLMSNEI